MAKNYYTVLTTYGAQLFAQAMANHQQVRITQFAVGDGNGRAVQPDSARTSLVREVHRANISAVSTDPRNNRQVIFELTIPENVGGFWIREMGIYDNNNRLVAYANCPDTYKPQLSEGSGKIQVVRMILLVSSSNAVTLSVDDSVIFVTRGQLTPKNITATSTNGFDETGHTHHIDKATTTQAGITQLVDNLTTADNTKALTAAQGKILQDSKMDGMVKTVIDMTPYYLNFWYPVIFSGLTQVGSQTARFAVRSQYQSKPAWSTHDLGFTLNLNWTSNASNWGGNEVTRVIERFDYRFTNENKSPVLKVGQIHESSEEYCYLRAGAIYEVWHEPYVTVAVHSTGYTWRNGSGHFSNTLRALTRYDSTLVPKTNLTVLRELADSKVSKAGDTMTGALRINSASANVVGLRDNIQKWFVGLNASNSDDILLHAFSHNNTLTLKSDKTESNKPLYVGGSEVFTKGNLTPVRDLNLTSFIPDTQIKYEDATPEQLPYGTYIGFTKKPFLNNQDGWGWALISKGIKNVTGGYAQVRIGLDFYGNLSYQHALNGQTWHPPKVALSRDDLANNLTTNDTTKALTAAQGKILQDSKMDGMVKTVINLNHLSSEVWYPVVFSGIGVKYESARFSVRNYFQGKPRWASHSDGFSMHIDWLSNASNWGGFSVVRVISRCDFLFTSENKSPILKIGQIHESSEEYCYLRGGATYEVWHEPYVRAAYHSSTYTWRSSAGDYTFSLPLITSYEPNLVPKANLDVLKALIDSKVSKSGGVVAGDLTINGYFKTLNNYVSVTATDTRFAGLDIIRTGSQGSWLSRMEALPDKRWKFWTENGHNIFLPAASGTVPLSHEVVSKAGDTMTGELVINHNLARIIGQRNGANKWEFGLKDSNSNEVVVNAVAHNNTLTLKSDKTESKKPLYVGENKVLTTVDLSVVRQERSKTIRGTNSNWDNGVNQTISVTGYIEKRPDGKIEQHFYFHNFKVLWFDYEPVSNGNRAVKIPIQLWESMPNKVTFVTGHISRNPQSGVTANNEALEWLSPVWAFEEQSGIRDHCSVYTKRITGGYDEKVDMYIKVEGY